MPLNKETKPDQPDLIIAWNIENPYNYVQTIYVR